MQKQSMSILTVIWMVRYSYTEALPRTYTFNNSTLCWRVRWTLTIRANENHTVPLNKVGDDQFLTYATGPMIDAYPRLVQKHPIWLHFELSSNIGHAYPNVISIFTLRNQLLKYYSPENLQATTTTVSTLLPLVRLLLAPVEMVLLSDLDRQLHENCFYCPPTSVVYQKGHYRTASEDDVRELRRQAVRVLLNVSEYDFTPGRYVLVLERPVNRRGWSNFDDVFAMVKQLVGPNMACIRFKPETLPALEQARLVLNSSVLIGPHGAGLGHSVFLCSSCVLVEIMPECII